MHLKPYDIFTSMIPTNEALLSYEQIGKHLLAIPANEVLPFLEPYLAEITHLSEAPVNGEIYGRKVLYSGPEVEVMVAWWRPQGQCFPHDHGNATGRVVLLKGSFREQKFNFNNNRINPGRKNNFQQGQVLNVCRHEIHSMKSIEDYGLTLHIYSPSITAMKVYDIENSLKYVVVDDCGAWRPQSHQIVSHDRLENP